MYIDVFDSSSKWVSRVFPQKDAPTGNKVTVKLALGSNNYAVGFGSYKQTGTATIYFKITNYIYSSNYRYILHTIGDELTSPYHNYPRGYNSSGKRSSNYDNNTNTGDDGTPHSTAVYNFNNDVFTHWTYDSNSYYADGEIRVYVGQLYTLTAVWNTTGHSNNASATVTWKNGDTTVRTDSGTSVSVGSILSTPPTLPTKTGYTCLGWFGTDGRVCYGGDYVPCTITYKAVYELNSLLNPLTSSGSAIHYDADDILVYEDETGGNTTYVGGGSLGKIYGKVNLVVTNQQNNKVDLLYLFQAKHNPASGDSWFDQNLKFDVRSYSGSSGGGALTTNSFEYTTWNSPHYTGTDNGVYKYAGLRTRTNQPNSERFGPLTEEYCLNTDDWNTKLVSKPTGSLGSIQFTMPAPGSDGVATAYVDFRWNWTKGSNDYGVAPYFKTAYTATTLTRLKVTFDWNVRYWKNYPEPVSDNLFQRVVKQPNSAHTVISAKPTAPSGYVFAGWNTLEDGSGTAYNAGDVIPASDNEGNWNLYAQWERSTLVTYKANGGVGADIQEYIDPATYLVRENTFTYTDYIFSTWNTRADGTGTNYKPGDRYSDIADVILYAIWIPEWDYDEDLDILWHPRPSLKLAAKRTSLEKANEVTLVINPELHPILNTSRTDKNFVSETSSVKYREEAEYRGQTSWTGSSGTTAYDSRAAYDPNYYPKWPDEDDPIVSLYRTDLMKNSARTQPAEFDINKEYHLHAKIVDGLWASSGYTAHAQEVGLSGTKNMKTNAAAKYSAESDWSNIALLLKYITKLLVHNPFMDEVLKESRGLKVENKTYSFGKQLREGQEPPETDFWQIRDHVQKLAFSLLQLRSNEHSVNGFTAAEAEALLIPTLKRALAANENLVYDPSQINPLLDILEKINSEHPKIAQENHEYDEADAYTGLTVGDTETANKIDQGTASSRILELDGERHINTALTPTASNVWKTESSTLENRVRDTSYKKVRIDNFEKDRAYKEYTDSENRQQKVQSTIDHIDDYDISQLDVERSLSDLLYLLYRMLPRPEGAEGAASDKFNSTITESERQSLISTYWDATNNKFKPAAFSNWKDGVWQTPENDIEEYKQYDFIENYNSIVGSSVLDTDNSYGANDFANNGCNAACMGLCTSGCYGTCVGACETACGSNCFYGCQSACSSSCGAACTSDCTGTCSRGCYESCTGDCAGTCSGGCYETCKGSCVGDCDGCTARCKRECKEECGFNCSSGCEKKCERQCDTNCYGQCVGGCENHCTTSCGVNCGANCSGGCKGSCKGSCSGGCNKSCGDSCNTGCAKGCGGGCTNGCATSCGHECETHCMGTCTGYCVTACTTGCKGTCKGTCSFDCGLGCYNGCGVGCKNTCQGQCKDGCKSDCNSTCTNTNKVGLVTANGTNCGGTCTFECLQTCNMGCGTECGGSCSSACKAECTGKCTKTCGHLCSRNCGNACNKNCTADCGSSCMAGCTIFCSGGCQNTCKEICTTECFETCGYNCINECTTLCYNSCKSECVSSCGTACSSTCGETCKASCDVNCSTVCQGTCKVYCNTTCDDSCSTACGTKCQGSCGHSCTDDCTAACGASCQDICAEQCGGSCGSLCTNGCNVGCKTSCQGTCGYSCNEACQAGCSSTCGSGCTGGCVSGCAGSCGSGCSGTCKTQCTTDCEGSCKEQCKESCWSGCSADCSVNCSTQCGGSCTGSCSDTCSGSCAGTCSTGCQGSCKGECAGSCEGECQGGCQGTCSSACGVTCGGSCSSVCTGSCSTSCTHFCTRTAQAS